LFFYKATIREIAINGNRLLFGHLLAAQGIGGGAKRDTARSAVAGAIAEPRKARFAALYAANAHIAPLTGQSEIFRVRVGSYRILYTIENDFIYVTQNNPTRASVQ
jgi:hypothetical protein